MANSDSSKPSHKARDPLTRPASVAPGPSAAKPAGRVRHDERGNAVWDWVVETGRNLIDSTSRLLKRLDAPELKVEEKADEELRLESDSDAGGGYDPYSKGATRKPGR